MLMKKKRYYNKNRTRIRTLLVLLAAASMLLTGCTGSMPELSEEEQELVVEYAAGVLLKHNKNYSGKIVDDEVIAQQLAKEREFAENTEQYKQLLAESKKAEESENDADGEASYPDEKTIEELAQMIGVSPVLLRYEGHLVCDSYPDVEEGEVDFVMTATPGNKLCVLQFSLNNQTAEDVPVNVYEKGFRFLVALDDGKTEQVQATFSLEDLSIYKEVIPAGETKEAILVLELQEDVAMNLQSLVLSVRGNGESAHTVLE